MLRLAWLFCALLWLEPCLAAQQSCPQPPALQKVTGKNIFTEQQEVDLGDAMGESLAREVSLIEDTSLAGHLEDLGGRLARYLPPNQLRFRFFLIDLPEVNAFSLAGGRIYVARKMVALTRNDDELAGVLAHEMGHIVTHQHAITMTRLFKQVLGVTEVGDRADIYDKFQRLLENERRKPIHNGGEGQEDQYVADQVALFAMARAGFAPQAYVDLWDRFNATHGKTGTWASDFFGTTKPEQRRLRELLKSVSTMPPECARIAVASPAEFQDWQARVIGASSTAHAESLPGLITQQKLAKPLRPDVNNLRFSPDGKFVLAQDEGGIHVLTRDPFGLLFYIDAPEADKAVFTPDSKSLVFKTPSLRIEVWEIATQKRTAVHEMLFRNGCVQSLLSPDGLHLACLDKEFTLSIYDVASGDVLVSKKNFIELSSYGWYAFVLLFEMETISNPKLVHCAFSPDGHYFLSGSSTHFLAYDLVAKRETEMPSSIHVISREEFAFIDNTRILAIDAYSPKKSPLLRFPSGERLQEIVLSASLSLGTPAHGNFVIVAGEMKDGRLAFIDLATGHMVGILKAGAGDVYDDLVVFEEMDGRILLAQPSTQKVVAHTQLSQSHLGDNRAIAVSPDFNWLAVSTHSRGATWDLAHNVRVQYVRGFSSAWFAEDGSLYADFPKQGERERSIVHLDALGNAAPILSVGEPHASHAGPYLVVRTPAKEHGLPRKDWTYELRDFRTKTTVWTHHFPQEPPSIAWNGTHNALLLGWSVSEDAAREELKQFPELRTSAEKEDMFYEVASIHANSPSGKLLVKTNRSSFLVQKVEWDGDWAAFQVSGNRVLTYSINSGKETGHVFGYAPVVSSAAGEYAVSAGEGEVVVYGLVNSDLQRSYKFPASVAYKQFSPDGKRLFVLTRDQTAYVLDLTVHGGS